MKYCVRCGRVLNSDDAFCYGCGMRQPYVPPEYLNNNADSAPSQKSCALVPVYGAQTKPRHKKGFWAYIVWSLILVPLFNIVGTPLAIAAALLTIDADTDNGSESERKLGTAAVLCIVATVIDVITLIFLSVAVFTRASGLSVF